MAAWGNGACSTDGLSFAEFLAEIASQGYVMIVSGGPDGSGSAPQNGSSLIASIDWIIEQNSNPCSRFYNQIDVDKLAVMGMSCGGLMALNAGGDTRLSTVVAMNSGLLNANANTYASFHTPVAYINGGPDDIAYSNGVRDYQQINNVPVYMANLPVGHGGTYSQDNGGEFGRVAKAWLNWHLKDDTSASGRGMFLGQNCGICNSNWTIQHKNF